MTHTRPSRRSILLLLASAASLPLAGVAAAQQSLAVVHKGPRCGCCDLWVRHLQKNGFATKVIETTNIDAVNARLGIPDDLVSCHTAEIGGYVVEGHVPASAINRLLSEKPQVTGIAVPGMPTESPGMEQGGKADVYDVILFGPRLRQRYMRFIGTREI